MDRAGQSAIEAGVRRAAASAVAAAAARKRDGSGREADERSYR